MNVQQLKKDIGKRVRLRPLPVRLTRHGQQLPSLDDDWKIEAVLEKPNRVRLSNVPTGHFVDLESDNVKQFQSPHFVILRCQLTLKGREVLIEPLPPSGRQTLPIGRYQARGPAITSRSSHVPTRPQICTGCTAAVLFRPVSKIRLLKEDGTSEPEEQFCPPCARKRGIRVSPPQGMSEEILYAELNPSLQYHLNRILRAWVLTALSTDEEIVRHGIRNVGAAITHRSLALIVEGPWPQPREVSFPLSDLEAPVSDSDAALVEFLRAGLVATCLR